jgi:hypothetical protein
MLHAYEEEQCNHQHEGKAGGRLECQSDCGQATQPEQSGPLVQNQV